MLRHRLDLLSSASQNVIVLSSLDIMENPVGGENIRLVIESPLRLLRGGSELRRFDFSAFLRSQMRRCSSLFAYYGDGELDIDFAGLSGEASLVKCLDDGIRYSQPHWSLRPNHAGLIGISRFAGVTPGILSLLTLGAYINAGKLASFGFGAYVTEAG
ncbi:MAG: CRISPR system precrRNA processing endoribonuclease RAMP protein Cas6 [Deltaproteobacteria bacterium]|nr:CRISPR system precrRNA processing endoribonuclease RAMP protein Cas6 [Deltaproteobacteria bacterium]